MAVTVDLRGQKIILFNGGLLADKDRAKAKRVMDAMMKMVTLDIQTLKDAAKKPYEPT
jgi:hypothetical protein